MLIIERESIGSFSRTQEWVAKACGQPLLILLVSTRFRRIMRSLVKNVVFTKHNKHSQKVCGPGPGLRRKQSNHTIYETKVSR
jgi:hypothetical protein